jgi:hypothetical protein
MGWIATLRADPALSAALSAVAAIIQAAGTVIAVIAVAITAWQIRDTRNALRATTALQMQKDGRDLLGSMEPALASYIYGYDPQRKYDADVVERARLRLVQILNFYAAGERQYGYGTIDDSLWPAFESEFCRVLTSSEPARRLWEQAVQKQIYRSSFIDIGSKCLQPPGPKP